MSNCCNPCKRKRHTPLLINFHYCIYCNKRFKSKKKYKKHLKKCK